jgi:hypothetical protein
MFSRLPELGIPNIDDVSEVIAGEKNNIVEYGP